MTEQIGVDLVAQGNIDSEAQKAAKAMAALAAQEEKVQQVAKALGTKDIKAVGAALDKVAQGEAKAAAKFAAQEKKDFGRETKYAKQKIGFLTKDKESQDKLLKLMGPEAAGALAEAAAAGAAVGVALLAATAIAVGLAVAISTAAFEAGNARDAAQAMFGVLNQGQGTKTLQLVDGLAEQLGMKFDDARKSFIQFRQSGLDNKQSAALLKLKADLDAVDPSGALAAQAVSKVLDLKGGKGTAEEMALLAKQAGIVGDGAKAAAARFTTMGGALASLDNTKTLALQQIFDKISPSINAAAGKVAQFADAFLKSERGQKLISAIGSAISGLVDIVASSIPTVVSVLETLVDVGTWIVNTYHTVADAFTSSSTAMAFVSAAWTGLKIIGYAVAAAIATLVAGAALLVAPLYAAAAAVVFLVGAIGKGLGALWDLVGTMAQAGANIIEGFIGGINSKIAQVKQIIGNLASSVAGGFANALGIHSPSKVFAEHGKNTALGYQQGVDKHMPDGQAMGESVTPGGSAGGAGSSPAPGSFPGGGLSVVIEKMEVPMGVDPDPFARAVRRELTLLLQMIQLSKGAA